MKRLGTHRQMALACLALMMSAAVPASLIRAAEPTPPLYVKQDTWTETMLAARAAVSRIQEQHARRPAMPGVQPFVGDMLQGTGPGQQVSVKVAGCHWMRLMSVVKSGGGNCHIWGDARLIAADGTVTWLGDLQPASIRVGWGELLVDKNWQNHPLRIGQRQFEHGVWMHANSDVLYDIGGKYERFEAWVGMDTDRAQGVAQFQVLFDPLDPLNVVWENVRRDYPLHAQWLTRDAGRDRELIWLTESKPQPMAAMIGRALGPGEASGTTLAKQLDELRKTGVPAGDRRWLDLYVRACRWQECRFQLDRVWLADLRQGLAGRFEELLTPDTSPDDPRWEQRTAALSTLVGPLPAARDFHAQSMRVSVNALATALKDGRFDASQLLARLDGIETRTRELTAALASAEALPVEQVAALAQEVEGFRRDTLLALRGMRQFLSVPARAGLVAEWESQWEMLQHDLGNLATFARVASETYRPESLVLETDRDPADVVLRRTAALLANLQSTSAAAKLSGPAKELAELMAANQGLDPKDTEARYALFAAACRVRRQIAFANPLLNFDQLLFLKRHRSSFGHMCDQYYAVYQPPGGGLCVLSDPFGPAPAVRDILADAVVQHGRLSGTKLEDGSCLSPDLSYDAKQIAFAYTECQGERGHDHHTDPSRGHWAAGRCYHVFKVNVDGTGLEQLTEGTWNDFDPCWMPSGRIAFITERRGGYLRCGRVCPTYTLYDMAADGADIRCLSYHETNEWHPSVAHDGRIVWTRWDYVDRHGCTAHMPWTTTPDGRDPRPVHGNYAPRQSRPDMELDVRAIPESRKYVATAAPHHGQAFGSLVLIDPRTPDDDGMNPLRRITPDVGFPESQGGAEAYGQAWPLSEDYYLCIYDAGLAQRKPGAPGHYGIYLLDSFGNKELLYRDAQIGCHNPIPLRPMPTPPVIPDASLPLAQDQPAEAVVGIANIYHSRQPWPEGTKIKSLRVYQVLPLSVASAAVTHNTGLQIPQGSDSINLARAVLGTVPVEADGSVCFKVPAKKELYFQALDENGLAITSMRSGTHFQPGEQAMCQGCHEPKPIAPLRSPVGELLATRRSPSAIQPDVDGTNPFSYPRLVQPVLDRHCTECHAKTPDKAPRLDAQLVTHPGGGWMNRQTVYYASYLSLAPKYG
ncbi:MAG: NPCBM/NEW2 domain-containing protein, partial [Planctomycetota bacterium]|nr:NPCBM/NEW2 domain-containing protein [Planctomycetota bacterium]